MVVYVVHIRGVAREYLHDSSQDRKNELDPSFKRSDPLHHKILIILYNTLFKPYFSLLLMQTCT